MIAQLIDKETRIKLMYKVGPAYKAKRRPIKEPAMNGKLKRYYETFFKKAVMSGRVHNRKGIILYAASIFNVQYEQAGRILNKVEAKLPNLVKHTFRERTQSARMDMIKKRPFSVIGEGYHD